MQQHHQITLRPPHRTDHEITSLHNDHNHNINNNKNNTFDHHHHLRSTSSNSSSSSSSSSSPQPPPLPHLQSQASRVVQIPLDQVYCRVLNSADNNIPSSADHQNSDHNHNNTSCRHRSNCFSSIWSRFFLIFIVFILLLIIFAGILYLSLNPKSPTFIIDSLSLKHSSSSPPENNYSDDDGFNNIIIVTYNLSMEASNPNSHLGFYYLQGGSASLSCNKQEMAHGTPPEFYTGKNGIRVFDLVLDSSSEALSKLFAETIMKEIDKYSNGKISLVLFIRLPVTMKVGELKLWKMKMEVTCGVSISLSSLQSSNNNNVDLEHHFCKNTLHW